MQLHPASARHGGGGDGWGAGGAAWSEGRRASSCLGGIDGIGGIATSLPSVLTAGWVSAFGAAGWVTLARAQPPMLSAAQARIGATARQRLRRESVLGRVPVMAGRYYRMDLMAGTATRHTAHEGATRGNWGAEIYRMMRFNNTVSKIDARTEKRIIIRQPAAPPSGRMLMRGFPSFSAPFDVLPSLLKNLFGSASGNHALLH